MSIIAELTAAEVASVERLRGNGDADLFAHAYALKKCYSQAPAGYLHLHGSVRPLRTGECIEQFLTEMRADRRLASSANVISEALAAIDRDGDGNRDSAAFFECVRWILERPRTVKEKLDVLRRLLDLQGRVTVSMQLFTGWR
jgi:hypothetical protein